MVHRFRSPIAVAAWVGWLLFAVANWIDLAVQGRDHLSVVAAAVLLLVTGVAYVTAQRPVIIADDAGITVRNPLRDHRIGWAAVTKVDLAGLLRVHAAGRVITAWAVHHSRRRQLTTEARARRADAPRRSPFGLPSAGRGPSYGRPASPVAGSYASPAANSPEAEAEKTVRLLRERAAAARAETTGTDAIDGQLEPLTSTWSWPALAAVVIPALILLVVYLL